MPDLARHWIGTIFAEWNVPAELTAPLAWLRGQQETCPQTNQVHWQLIASFSKPQRLAGVKRLVGNGHWEPTRSAAAIAYVHKEETAVLGTRFELGNQLLRRNHGSDWEKIRDLAKADKLDDIPGDVFIRYYR